MVIISYFGLLVFVLSFQFLAVDSQLKKLRVKLFLGGNHGRDSNDHKTPQRLYIEVFAANFDFIV